MAPSEGVCPPEKAWPAWTNYVIAGVTLAIAVAVALQRHLFGSPSPAAALLAVVVAPWILEIFLDELDAERWPLAKTLAFSAIVIGGTLALVLVYPTEVDFAPFFMVMLAGHLAATAGPRYGAAVGISAATSLVILELDGLFTGSVIWAFAMGVAWLTGSAMRSQVSTLTDLRIAQADLAQRAATEERQRLAREIHDLIAHSLAVTMLHLTGARLALRDGDTTDALEALEQAEHAGREAMAEIRRTVGLLGPGGSGTGNVPTPKAADVPELVGEFCAAGLELDATLRGDLDRVPLSVGVALYRIVQESLSNAVKHAPGAPVQLRVDVKGAVVSITVANAFPNPVVAHPQAGTTASPEGGHGVRGMAERAALLGGTLEAGPRADTWIVEAGIPFDPSHLDESDDGGPTGKTEHVGAGS